MDNQNPILFLEPILKENIWGGSRLHTEFGYPAPSGHTGECWGISAHPNGDVEVKNGRFAGRKLSELWSGHRELFGNLPMEQFPLLVKIIDANDDLSIQVHPDDAYANIHEHGSLGKTECWYMIDCPKDARLVVGHHARTKDELISMIHEKQWDKLIRQVPIQKGDFIQIDPGTIHAITAGCLVLETQQNSDITYRVYDYGRLADGRPRQLHIEKSIDVITAPAKNTSDSLQHLAALPENVWHEIISCPYYKVFKLNVNGTFYMRQNDPFFNVSILAGSGHVCGCPVKKGDHFIIPYGTGQVIWDGTMESVISTVPF